MSSTRTPPETLVGQTLQGRYRILEFIAEGAMGAVYRAERTGLERAVAIKFLRPLLAADTQGRLRFEREAKTMSRLDHPNCVSVTDFGIAPDPYIVMEYVTGETVREIFDRGPVEIDRSLYICQQILAGLAHAHDKEIVHRDIKPANIMITEAQGTEGLVRILDFGLAKLHNGPNKSDLSSPYLIVGTPNYMSPEQASAGKTDARSDLYSVGVLLFEALTGTKPFDAEDPRETLRMHREAPVPRIAKLAPKIFTPPGLQAILDKAMAKKPADRYATATEFSDAVTALRESLKANSKRASGKSRAPAAFAETQETSRAELFGLEATPIGSQDTLAIEALKSEKRDELVTPGRAEPARKARSSPWGLLLLLLLAGGSAFAYYDPLEVVPDWTLLGISKRSMASATKAPPPPVRAEPQAPQLPIDPPPTGADPALALDAIDAGPVWDAGLSDAALEQDAGWEKDAAPEGYEGDTLADEVADQDLDDELIEFDEDDLDALDEQDSEKAVVIDSEPTASTESPPPRPVRNVADARALASQGKRSEAIIGLRKLRSKQPKAAYVRLLLGDLYFEQRWWSDGLAEYAAAINLKRSLRSRALINKNAIHALGSPKTRRKAQSLLIKKIGRASLPYLRRAASRDKSHTIQKYAAALVKRISSPKRRSTKKRRSRR